MRLTKTDMRGLITCIGISLLIGLIGCLVLTGCEDKEVSNYTMFDTTYKFDYVIIALPNGEIVEGEVETWRDYDNGDELQVKVNGKTYLTSYYNCTLIKEG